MLIHWIMVKGSIYIIMWAVGLSFFLSVRPLVAYGNQNQTTHIKTKHNSEFNWNLGSAHSASVKHKFEIPTMSDR